MIAGPGCTGFAASWCPNCGDCTCARGEEGDWPDANDPACPLHGLGSEHYELEYAAEQVEQALEDMDDRPLITVRARRQLSDEAMAKVKRFVESSNINTPISIVLDEDVTVELIPEGWT
jgi:hypothetical protein